MRSGFIRRLWRSEDGSVLLEGAIMTPFLCILVFGTLEFAYYFFQQHLVSSGIRDAARYLARTSDPTDSTYQATAQNLAAFGNAAGTGTARVAGFGAGNVAISTSAVANAIDGSTGLRPYREASAACGGPDSITIINVTGSFTYAPLGFWSFFGFSIPTVSVTHRERCIGRG